MVPTSGAAHFRCSPEYCAVVYWLSCFIASHREKKIDGDHGNILREVQD